MLLEFAPWRIDIRLTAAPPHMVAVLRSMNLARPIEVLFLGEFLLTCQTELIIRVLHYLSMLHLLHFSLHSILLVSQLSNSLSKSTELIRLALLFLFILGPFFLERLILLLKNLSEPHLLFLHFTHTFLYVFDDTVLLSILVVFFR